MADEITITSHIQISKDNLDFRSRPESFTTDMETGLGPVPGMIACVATGTGTTPSFTGLTTPQWILVRNYDDQNRVEIGLEISAAFEEMMEVGPGEHVLFRLSRNITIADLRIRAINATCNVFVGAFEK